MNTGTPIALAVFTTGCASPRRPSPSFARLPKHGSDPVQFKRVPQQPSQMAWLH